MKKDMCCTCVAWKIIPSTEHNGEGVCKKKKGKRMSYSMSCPAYKEDTTFSKWANKKKRGKK